jgi:cell division protein FtsI (penicillin-binding protein 3)
MNVEPMNGCDVVTTLDMDFQDVAEESLRRQLIEQNAGWGTVVLMEVATGEIKAIANLTRQGAECYEDNNYALAERTEPGSTFKLASLMALLDDGGMSLDDEIDTEGGTAFIDGRTFRDDHKEGVITVQRMFEVSSNIGFIKAVKSRFGDKPARYVDYIRDLGFDKPLGTRIKGEVSPRLWGPEDKGRNQWSGVSLANMAYGYGFEISPLHTLSLYNAVANGGRMVRPMLVKELREYGRTVETFDTETINPSICSARALRLVRRCLEGVVDAGTGNVLKNPYYSVAAKTGTAQLLHNGRYTDESGGRHYLATMVGYFPADNPKYSCIVAIKTYFGRGSWNTYYGASLAGPVFRAVADRVYSTHTDWQMPVEKGDDRQSTVPVKGGHMSSVREVADIFDVKLRGASRKEQWATTRTDSTFVAVAAVKSSDGVVPRVTGMGLSDALYLLESAGLRVEAKGKGRVVSQSLTAGGRASKGSSVTIVLK